MNVRGHLIDKPNYSRIPFDALEEVAKVLAFGAEKYGERNWEKGRPHSESVSALMRHMKLFFQDGEDYDVESGLFHTAHIMCIAMFILVYQLREIKGIDDRPSGGVDALEIDEAFKQLKDEQSEKQGGQRGAGLEEFKAFMADDDDTEDPEEDETRETKEFETEFLVSVSTALTIEVLKVRGQNNTTSRWVSEFWADDQHAESFSWPFIKKPQTKGVYVVRAQAYNSACCRSRILGGETWRPATDKDIESFKDKVPCIQSHD